MDELSRYVNHVALSFGFQFTTYTMKEVKPMLCDVLKDEQPDESLQIAKY